MRLDYSTQKCLVALARYCVDAHTATKFADEVETLTRAKLVDFRIRNQVRGELKSKGFSLPARRRSR